MLSIQQTDTIRAALRYWCDEIVPHGPSVATAYFDTHQDRLLSISAVQHLADRFRHDRLLAIEVEPGTRRVVSRNLTAQSLLLAIQTETKVLTVIDDDQPNGSDIANHSR